MPSKSLASRDWAVDDRAGRAQGQQIVIAFTACAEAPAKPLPRRGRGKSLTHATATVEALLVLRAALGLSLRATEGLAEQLRARSGGTWAVPDHTTLSRRMKSLTVPLPRPGPGRLVVMVDSTGLKVAGEGEWFRRKFGPQSRRKWAKAHVAVERGSGLIVNVVLTDNETNDCEVFGPLLEGLPLEGAYVLGDGAYHTRNCHRTVHARGGRLLAPPRIDAAKWENEPAFRWRNQQLRMRNLLGDKAWRITSGYSRRSYAETVMHRWKSLTGGRMASRSLANQEVELRLRAAWLNRVQLAAGGSQTPSIRPVA